MFNCSHVIPTWTPWFKNVDTEVFIEITNMSLNEYLNRFNQAQRIVAGIVFGMIVIFTFAHNPISGYITKRYVSFEKQLPPCSEEARRKYREFLTDYYATAAGSDSRRYAEMRGGVSKEIDEQVSRCHIAGADTPVDSPSVPDTQVSSLPFNLWKSNAPLFEWCGSVLHFIYLIAATTIIGAFFVFVVFARNVSNRDE